MTAPATGTAAPPKRVFLVGCPRSGTTWLQIILGAHPQIATVRETHLFDWYLAGIQERWTTENVMPAGDGLRLLMSSEDVDRACRGFAEIVFDKIAARKPGAAVTLEKTPANLQHHKLVKRVFPDALILHIVRDPRAVAASLFAVADENWGQAVPRDAVSAARLWRSSVRIGRDELTSYGDQHREVRYEDLHADPDGQLAPIFDWLGIAPMPYDPARFSIGAVRAQSRQAAPSEPAWDARPNFFRRGAPDGWASELGAAEIATIEAICGDLMQEMGYQRHTAMAAAD